ncbi:MAG: hypothetical protein RJB39_228 [Candidatus Parcubacteria bacterium]|jgi:hypothetical protein
MRFTPEISVEIFSNPFDLSVVITQENGKYGFIITRGEKHKFRTLVRAVPGAASIQDATDTAIKYLTNVVETTQLAEGDPPVLTLDLIAQIRSALATYQIAATWDLQSLPAN